MKSIFFIIPAIIIGFVLLRSLRRDRGINRGVGGDSSIWGDSSIAPGVDSNFHINHGADGGSHHHGGDFGSGDGGAFGGGDSGGFGGGDSGCGG